MDRPAVLALLMLSELPRVGERALARVQQLARWRDLTLTEILALPPPVLAREYGLPAPALARLSAAGDRHISHCRRLLSQLRAIGAHVCQPGDAVYPHRWLQRVGRAPPMAYLYGNPRALAAPTLAILSSRTVTEGTVAATIQVARHAAREGFTMVTGGMKTTHRIAAVTVRASGARRAIILDRGLFAAFGSRPDRDPFGFGPGRTHFDLRTSLAISPFRPHDHATPRNGRRRDQLIAALADIVVAASARPGGEIERVCLQAIDRGQCVLMWQGANAGLVAAGAPPIDETDLHNGLHRFLASRSAT